MTEEVVGNAEQNSDMQAVDQQPSSAGMLLRQAREVQQMSVQTLASALKVPVYKLQALEEDRWDQLTDSVFTRSLALSVCRVLRIPSEPILAGLPKLEGAKLSTNPEGINAPFKEKSLRSLMSPSQEPSSGKLVKVAVALLIAIAGGAGLYFLPQWQSAEEDQEQAAEVAAASEPLFMPQQAQPAAPAQAESAEAAPAATPAAAPAVALVEPALKEVPAAPVAAETPVAAAPANAETAPAAAANAAPVAEPASAPAAAVAAGSAVLRFTATGETWVQVRDAQKRVVMEKILKAGDVYEETAAGRPLQVVVGNSGVTQLQIDGAAFDLAAVAKNNVARFEVK